MERAVCPSGRAHSGETGGELDVAGVYRSALPRLARIAAGMGLRRPDAEDALHDSYVALLEHRGRFGSAADAEHWLVRVVVNRCLLHHRQHGRRAKLAERRPPEKTAEPDAEVRQVVQDALAELPGDEVALLVLRYFCAFNASEIGELLSMPAGTVRSRLRQARLTMAERLLAKGLVGDDA